MGQELQDRTCVVTGSSRGIGRAIAEAFGSEGADVVVNYCSSEGAAHDAVAAVEDAGGRAVAVQADVSDRSAVAAMRERTEAAFGRADVLVNNAGVTVDRTFENMTPDDWQRVMDVNLGGAFNCTDAFYDDVRDSPAGRVVNVSSVVGQQGNYGQANYAAAKSGLLGFTRTLALELADAGATANCVAPGFVSTDMLADVPQRVRDSIRERIPLSRFADPEDVAGLVRFLATDDADYMTGQVLEINGGMDCNW